MHISKQCLKSNLRTAGPNLRAKAEDQNCICQNAHWPIFLLLVNIPCLFVSYYMDQSPSSVYNSRNVINHSQTQIFKLLYLSIKVISAKGTYISSFWHRAVNVLPMTRPHSGWQRTPLTFSSLAAIFNFIRPKIDASV